MPRPHRRTAMPPIIVAGHFGGTLTLDASHVFTSASANDVFLFTPWAVG
jgi:hypothetical protein